MIDLSKYVRHYLPTKCLKKYLSKGSGNSLKFLVSILHGKNGQFRDNADYLSMGFPLETEVMQLLFDRLKQCGPALITNFQVEEDFVGGTWVIFHQRKLRKLNSEVIITFIFRYKRFLLRKMT
jgi:hypothetical protein